MVVNDSHRTELIPFLNIIYDLMEPLRPKVDRLILELITARTFKWLLKKWPVPAASSFPHGSAPEEWMAGIHSSADRWSGAMAIWIPGSALRPRNDDPVDFPIFFNILSR